MAKSVGYSVHPSIIMMENWIAKLGEKTGRSLEEWVTHIRHDGPKDEAACITWLKETYELGTNTAAWLTEVAHGGPERLAESTAAGYLQLAPMYVEQQYEGKKAALRPMFERLLALGRKLGKDVKVCPCKTIVPLYRQNVFAQLKPTTNKRVDLGLALGKLSDAAIRKAGKRLIDTGGKAKKDRITHRVVIERIEDIDEYVARWLTQAYELDAAEADVQSRPKPAKRR